VIVLGRRFCRYDFERGNAVLVFAISYCVGIFMPMAAIWANVPFYAYSASQTAKPASYLWADLLVAALERTALSHILGAVGFVGLGYFLARRATHWKSAVVSWRGRLH